MNLFDSDFLSSIENKAWTSLRKRINLNIHKNYSDPCQRFFNAICSNSYLRPHCHSDSQGTETLFAIKGCLGVIIFESNGVVKEKFLLQPAAERMTTVGAHAAVGVDLHPGVWHSVVALSDVAILLEIKNGPFDINGPKFLADWAPEENTPAAEIYLKKMKSLFV